MPTQLSNSIIGAGYTLDELLAEAKRVLGNANRFSTDTTNKVNLETQGNHPLKAETPDYTYSDVAKDAAIGGMIPASFLGGPVGMAAAGGLGLEGIKNFVDRPSYGSGFGALLGLIPGFAAARGIGRAAEAAPAVERVAAKVMPTMADIIKGEAGTAEAATGNPAMYEDVLSRQPKWKRPIVNPPQAVHTPYGTDIAAMDAPVPESFTRSINEDYGPVLSKARQQIDALTRVAEPSWAPGDLTAGPANRVNPLLPDTRMANTMAREKSLADLVRKMQQETASAGGPPSRQAGPGASLMSAGEDAGIRSLDALLERTGGASARSAAAPNTGEPLPLELTDKSGTVANPGRGPKDYPAKKPFGGGKPSAPFVANSAQVGRPAIRTTNTPPAIEGSDRLQSALAQMLARLRGGR